MKKRVSLLIILFMLCLSVSACSLDDNSESNEVTGTDNINTTVNTNETNTGIAGNKKLTIGTASYQSNMLTIKLPNTLGPDFRWVYEISGGNANCISENIADPTRIDDTTSQSYEEQNTVFIFNTTGKGDFSITFWYLENGANPNNMNTSSYNQNTYNENNENDDITNTMTISVSVNEANNICRLDCE